MATLIRNGEQLTSGASETEYELTPPYSWPTQDVRLDYVSGTVQYGVGEKKTAFTPVITSTNDSLSASGDKAIVTCENGKFNLRLKGSGVVAVTW